MLLWIYCKIATISPSYIAMKMFEIATISRRYIAMVNTV